MCRWIIRMGNDSTHIFVTVLVATVFTYNHLERRKHLKERVKKYLLESGCPKTTLCKRLGISTNHLYAWFKGERNISDELRNKIRDYLDKYSVR